MISNLSKKWIILMVMVYLLIVSVVMLNLYPASPLVPVALEQAMTDAAMAADTTVADALVNDGSYNRLEIMFSHTGHFYDSDIEVSIYASIPEATIYYTLDGSEPTEESDIYTQPLRFKAAETVNDGGVYPLKAIAVYDDLSALLFVHTYFVAKDAFDRFDVMTISLTTNDDYLYDYDTGIFVAGRTRDEYIEANSRSPVFPNSPANFNWRGLESERPVYVEIFESDGRRVIAQGAGMRVHGGWSRAEKQKSIRLIARNIYEPGEGRFGYDFFPDDVREDEFGTPITRYDQLILSNNANDRNFAMLRQEVNYNLARQAGLRTVSPMRAVSVFLNGEYHGFAWLEVNINEQYLEHLYSAPVRDFQIVGNGELWIASEDPFDIEAIEHLESFYFKDFTDDAVLAEFESLVDLDYWLLYYAYQTYVGNRDWPNNNMKRWRYLGDWEEGMAPELDGRWRIITYDLDFLMSLYENDVRANSPSFSDTMTPGNDRYSHLLAALFVRPELVDRYAMFVCDVANNVITPENTARETEKLYSEAYREIGHALEAGKYDHWVSYHSIEDNHKNMVIYMQQRYDYFLNAMREYFEWEEGMFTVQVSGGDAYIGSQVAESSTYFTHLEIPLRPALSRNEVFDHWVLNGEVINTPDLTVSISDADEDGVVSIELVTLKATPTLVISEAYGSSERNGAVLMNTSSETLTTAGLYFTDDLNNPLRWAMPMATLKPGETLEFAGRSSRDPDDIHKVQFDFNVRVGEILFLCNEDGEVLDWFAVEPAD